MKKIIGVLSIVGVSILAIMGYNVNKYPSIEEYERVIEKVNNELGSSISIPAKKKNEVYNNIKNIPLDEFEAKLRKEYNEIKDLPNEIYLDENGNRIEKSTVQK